MALKDIVVETDSTIYNGHTIPLRGITPHDIKVILTRAKRSADLLFDLAEREGVQSPDDLTQEKMKSLAHSAITELPVLVSNIIAQCSDDIDSAPIVEKLPVPVQFDCLRKISRMTFTDATNFGEFLGNVTAAVKAMGSLSPETNPKNGAPQPSVGILM